MNTHETPFFEDDNKNQGSNENEPQTIEGLRDLLRQSIVDENYEESRRLQDQIDGRLANLGVTAIAPEETSIDTVISEDGSLTMNSQTATWEQAMSDEIQEITTNLDGLEKYTITNKDDGGFYINLFFEDGRRQIRPLETKRSQESQQSTEQSGVERGTLPSVDQPVKQESEQAIVDETIENLKTKLDQSSFAELLSTPELIGTRFLRTEIKNVLDSFTDPTLEEADIDKKIALYKLKAEVDSLLFEAQSARDMMEGWHGKAHLQTVVEPRSQTGQRYGFVSKTSDILLALKNEIERRVS